MYLPAKCVFLMWPTMFGMVHSFWWGKFNPRSPWNILEFCAGIGSLCPAGSSLASLEALVDGRKNNWLVLCFFPYTGNVIIPTDGLNDLIFFRGLETTNQYRWFIRVDAWLRNPAPVDRWFMNGKHPMILLDLAGPFRSSKDRDVILMRRYRL